MREPPSLTIRGAAPPPPAIEQHGPSRDVTRLAPPTPPVTSLTPPPGDAARRALPAGRRLAGPRPRSHRAPRDPLLLPRGGGAARARPGLSRPCPARPGPSPRGSRPAPPRPAMPPKKQQQPAGGSKKADQKKKEKIIEVRRPRPPLSRRGLSWALPLPAASRLERPREGSQSRNRAVPEEAQALTGTLPGPSCAGPECDVTAQHRCAVFSPRPFSCSSWCPEWPCIPRAWLAGM